jgi:gamma-glutamyltranspeptidase
LKAIVSEGADVFYQGWIAQAITDTVKEGAFSLEDLRTTSLSGASASRKHRKQLYYDAAAEFRGWF